YQKILAALNAILRADPALVERVATDPAVLRWDNRMISRPAIEDLVGIQAQGLSAQLFAGSTATGTAKKEPNPPSTIDYGPQAPATPLPGGGVGGVPMSGIWQGFLEAPETAEFLFAVDADAASVTLTLDGVAVPVNSATPVSLTAGQLSKLILTVNGV